MRPLYPDACPSYRARASKGSMRPRLPLRPACAKQQPLPHWAHRPRRSFPRPSPRGGPPARQVACRSSDSAGCSPTASWKRPAIQRSERLRALDPSPETEAFPGPQLHIRLAAGSDICAIAREKHLVRAPVTCHGMGVLWSGCSHTVRIKRTSQPRWHFEDVRGRSLHGHSGASSLDVRSRPEAARGTTV